MLQAHFYCGLEVVRNGQVERAFNYIASLDSNQRKECCNYTKSIISVKNYYIIYILQLSINKKQF